MKFVRRISIAIIIAVLVFTTVSCDVYPPLTKDLFNLAVGEYVDIAEYVEGDFELSVQDPSVVTVISGTVLRAQKPGSTTVVVGRGRHTDVINVYVSYAPVSLTVSCSSPLFTDIKGSVLEFYADLGANADPSTQIIWKVGSSTAGVGKTFQLTLNDYAKYKVSAHAAGQEQSLTAVCAKSIDQAPTISCDGPEVVTPPYTQLKFTASYTCEDEPLLAWYLNGQYQSDQAQFDFTPQQVGEYVVWATVNGVKTNQISFVAGGEAQPQNVTVDYDSDFPNLYLRWDGVKGASYQVSVGDVVYYSDSPRFAGNSFDLSGLVNNGDTVSVKCNGGEHYSPSDAVSVSVPTLSQKAGEYLSKKYFDGNYYMTSDQEVYDLVAYAVIFRPNATAVKGGEKVSLSLYMGYDSQHTAAMLLSKGWAYLEQTGKYSLSASGKTEVGSEVNFDITFLTGDQPYAYDVSYKTAYQSLITPSFRGGATTLAIDSAKNGGVVTTTDELYYMVQKGYKPQPQEGSAAERIYDKARTVLGQIISDDMTDEKKARAIYEWINWQTTYDYEVLSITDLAEVVRQPAYYMEGVFDNGFAVCDGISKSMSLLCNMVGLPCVRVVGIADNGSPSRHAWNKVCIDDEWYIVDATWSDGTITMDNTVYEGALHAYFLKADCEMTTHKPNFPQLYPAATAFYDGDMPYVADASLDQLAAAIKSGVEGATYEVTLGESVTQRDFYCIQIRLSLKAKNYFKSSAMLVNLAISEAVSGSVPWQITGDYLLIMLYN